MIEMNLSDSLTDEVARAESVRARKLAEVHIASNSSPNVYIVGSLEEMLETSVILYGVAKSIVELTISKNLAFQQFIKGRSQNESFAAAMASGRLGSDAVALFVRQIK